MELHGLLKVIILVFALMIPISIVFLVYRTLFTGLNSITSSKNPGITPDDTEKPGQAQNRRQAETDKTGQKIDTDMNA